MFKGKTKEKPWFQKMPLHMSSAFCSLGIKLPDEHEIKVINYESDYELEKLLDGLCELVFEDTRQVRFHTFRRFPYIIHPEYDDGYDAAGDLTHYTKHDYFFLYIVKQFLQKEKDGVRQFVDVDWLKENAEKKEKGEDCPISNMPADFLNW